MRMRLDRDEPCDVNPTEAKETNKELWKNTIESVEWLKTK